MSNIKPGFFILKTQETKKYIKDRLDIDSPNCSVCILHKPTNTIKVFGNRLLAIESDPLYIVVPQNHDVVNGSYYYDMNGFFIYKIDKDHLDQLNVVVDDPSTKYTIKINDQSIVYTTKTGLINEDQSFDYNRKLNAREYACVLLKVPNSGTIWLDDLIKSSIYD